MQFVRTTLDKGNVSRAVIERLLRPGVLLKAWAIWIVVVGGLIAVARGAPRDMIDALALAISASAGAVISVAFSSGFTVMRIRSALKPNDGVLGEHVYEVKNEGLHEKTEVNETLGSWAGVKDVLETKRFAFIELRSGSFHIIPRQSFRSPEHERHFLSEVRRRANCDA